MPFSFNLKNTFSVSDMAVLLPINSLSLYPSRNVLGLPPWHYGKKSAISETLKVFFRLKEKGTSSNPKPYEKKILL